MLWSSGKRKKQAIKIYRNPPTLADITASTLSSACENSFNSVITRQLPPYAKNAKICILK
jgi:hypothetical protein